MSLHFGRVCVYISYPFAAMLALILLLDTGNTAAVGLLAAVIHELGHMLWLACSRTGIKRISLDISGVHIRTASSAIPGYRQEAALALAGPTSNLCAALPLFLLPDSDFCERLRIANIAVMGVNLLPIRALDGGSALEALLSMRTSRERAEKLAFIVSLLFLAPLLVLGFVFVLQSKYNFSLLILSLFLLYSIIH